VIFGADIIAGFPTETEAMFANSLAIVEECGLTHLHVFPFSPRPGTPAARTTRISQDVVEIVKGKAMSDKLRELRLDPGGTNPQETAKFFADETELWGKVIRQANITAQ